MSSFVLFYCLSWYVVLIPPVKLFYCLSWYWYQLFHCSALSWYWYQLFHCSAVCRGIGTRSFTVLLSVLVLIPALSLFYCLSWYWYQLFHCSTVCLGIDTSSFTFLLSWYWYQLFHCFTVCLGIVTSSLIVLQYCLSWYCCIDTSSFTVLQDYLGIVVLIPSLSLFYSTILVLHWYHPFHCSTGLSWYCCFDTIPFTVLQYYLGIALIPSLSLFWCKSC